MGGFIESIKKNTLDWVINPFQAQKELAGEGLRKLNVKGEIVDTLEHPFTKAKEAITNHDVPTGPDAPPPLPPTPSDPGTSTAMADAARKERVSRRGKSSTYLTKGNSSLLDQPGTFFRSSLGG